MSEGHFILRQQYFMICRPFVQGPAGDFRPSVQPSIFHPRFSCPINIPQGAIAPWGRFIQMIRSPNWNSSIKFFLIVNKLLIPSYLTITQLCIKSICSYIPKRCIKFDFPDTWIVGFHHFHQRKPIPLPMEDRVNKYSANIQCFTVFVQKQNGTTNDFTIYDCLE